MIGDIIKCKVKISKQLFPKGECIKSGDFAILSMDVLDTIEGEPQLSKWGNIVVLGNVCEMEYNEVYTLLAEECENEKFGGVQYSVIQIGQLSPLETREEQEIFLSTVFTGGIVQALFDAFPNPIEVIAKNDTEKLCTVHGIGAKKANRIINRYFATIDNSKAYIELYKYGLKKKMIDKLISHYNSPETVIKKIEENIYILADEVDGIGFKKADELALQSGIESNDIRRVEAFIKYHLRKEGESGNSYLTPNDLMLAIEEELGEDLDMEVLKKCIHVMYDNKVLWWNEEQTMMGLYKYRVLEQRICDELVRIMKSENKFDIGNWESIVKRIEELQGWEYTNEQKLGIETVLKNQLIVVTGLAGTGKTTVTNAMTKILNKYTIIQSALAGRAAQRMKEVTGIESNTIHKTLEYNPSQGFMKDEEDPIQSDIIILDEASMVGGELFLSMLKAIKSGTKLVILGDYGQMSSIGSCNVFYDLIKSGVVPLVKLTVIHRQAKKSAIKVESIKIRNNEQIIDSTFEGKKILGELQDLELNITKDKTKVQDMIVKEFREKIKMVDSIMDLQIIVPMRLRGDISTFNINNRIQQLYNPGNNENSIEIEVNKNNKYVLKVGDKVVNTRNNKKTVDINSNTIPIFNGDIGIIKEIDLENEVLIIDFYGKGMIVIPKANTKNIELAYAITGHKIQGSQVKTAIVGIDYSAYKLLTSEWLYTALTRAEDLCVLVGLNEAIRYATSQVETTVKQTFLSYFLNDSLQ